MKRVVFPSLWLLICCLSIRAAAAGLDAEEIGLIFGYPGDQLVVEDYSEQEREIHHRLASADEPDGAAPGLDPASIVAAFRVMGQVPNSFYPMHVLVTKKGALPKAPGREFADRLMALPALPLTEGGRGPFGELALGGEVVGVLFPGKLRVPAENPLMTEPGEDMAVMAEVRWPGSDFDVRIALLSAFPKGAGLVEVAGGEAYFQEFSPPPSGPEGEPGLDETDLQGFFLAAHSHVVQALGLQSGRAVPARGLAPPPPPGRPRAQRPATVEIVSSVPPALGLAPAPWPVRHWKWMVGLLLAGLACWWLGRRRLSRDQA